MMEERGREEWEGEGGRKGKQEGEGGRVGGVQGGGDW
jgi:hypothetical protein